ncbi:MAG: hypothetical protein ACR2NU_12235, partial [Aeoliella sp.]
KNLFAGDGFLSGGRHGDSFRGDEGSEFAILRLYAILTAMLAAIRLSSFASRTNACDNDTRSRSERLRAVTALVRGANGDYGLTPHPQL